MYILFDIFIFCLFRYYILNNSQKLTLLFNVCKTRFIDKCLHTDFEFIFSRLAFFYIFADHLYTIMKINCIKYFTLAIFLITFLSAEAQSGVFHEVGFGVGPVSFRGDWGERGDTRTNLGNTGFGVNISHYANYAYTRNAHKYFNKHFKMRNSLVLHQTSLNHYGRWQAGDGEGAIRLQNMSGESTVVELGSGLEWFWREIRDFERQVNNFQPYAGAGFNLVYFNPRVETSLPGEIGSVDNTFGTFLGRTTNSARLTLSASFQGGTRYRLNPDVDLFIEGRWHYFMSDYVDGLNPMNSNNKSNDWIFFLNIGFNYYFK